MSGTTSLTLEYWVEVSTDESELACTLSLTDVDFTFTAIVGDMDVSIQLTTIDIAAVEVLVDNIGGQDATRIE